MPARLREAACRREFVRSTGTNDKSVGKLVASVLLADWRKQLFELERGRVDDESVLKLVDGTPELGAVGGYVSLVRAADLSGMDEQVLVQAAAISKLILHCRLSRSSGRGFLVNVAELDPDDPEAGRSGGLVIPSMNATTAAITNHGGQVLRVVESSVIASAILAQGLNEIEILALEAPGRPGMWFCPESSVRVLVSALEVSSAEVEVLRIALAAKVPGERVDRARNAQMARRGDEGAVTGKWAQKRFTEALEGYCTDNDGLRGDLRSEHDVRQRRGQMAMFTEFMGDLRLCEIDGDVLRAYRDGPLKTIPGTVNKLPKSIRRDTMTATIEALREDGREWPLLSDAMRHERMSHLAKLFEWLEGRSYLKPNPAAGLRGETGATKAERRERARGETDDEGGREPFTGDQLRAIFGQLHFQVGHGRHVQKPSSWLPFEYWLPALGLLSGLRIKEGAQLHLDDVRRVEDVWMLSINESTADKSLKNEQSVRLVPVHPELVRLGFLDYCDALRVAGFRRVFPELTWSTSPAKYAKEPIRKMSAMLEGLGMPRDGTLVFHCLRHNCNNALVRALPGGLPSGGAELSRFARLRIMGHTVGDDVNARHYTTAKPHELAALIAGVNFDLPPIAPFDIKFGLTCVRSALLKKAGDRRGKEDMGPIGQFIPCGFGVPR